MPKVDILGTVINYVPYQSGMYMTRLKAQLEQNPSYKRVFKNNITNQFVHEQRDVVNPNVKHTENTILMCFGGTGTGKSICMISLVKLILPENGRFTHENICFTDGEILELKEKVPQNSFIMRDENPMKAVFGVGSARQSEEIDTIAESCRKHGLSLIFVEPEFREYSIAKYYLETVDMDTENRVTRMAVLDPKTKTYLGAIYIPVLEEENEDWIEYSKKKDKFIQKILKGDYRGSKTDLRQTAIKVKEKIDMFNTKQEKLAFLNARFPNFTNQEIKDILSYCKIIDNYGKHFLFDEDEQNELEED